MQKQQNKMRLFCENRPHMFFLCKLIEEVLVPSVRVKLMIFCTESHDLDRVVIELGPRKDLSEFLWIYRINNVPSNNE